jgi:ATP-binding cassette subfamily B protein
MNVAGDLAACVWPCARAGEATRALAVASGLVGRGAATHQLAPVPSASAWPAPGASLAEIVSDAARALGLEVETRDFTPLPLLATRYALRASPVLVGLADGAGLLAVVRAGTSSAMVVGPRGRARVPMDVVEDALWASTDSDPTLRLDEVQGRVAGVFPDSRGARRAARALVAPRLAHRILAEGWAVRAPSAALRNDLAKAGVWPRALAIAAAYIVELVVFLGIWRHVGRQALAAVPRSGGAGGRLVLLGLLALWAALQLGAATAVRRLALDVGAAVRVWLLRGALRLDPEDIRSAGLGQLLGRALDAEALDALALGGAVEALAGSFELGFGAAVLALGVSPAATLTALGVAAVSLGLGIVALSRRHAAWSEDRRAITHDLIERMAGHRTLLVQARPARQRRDDDRALASYATLARRLDRVATALEVGLPRSFLLVSLGVVAAGLGSLGAWARPGGTAGTGGTTPELIATSLGGIWLAYAGLRRVATAAGELIAAREAWRRVRPLVGAHGDAPGVADTVAADDRPATTAERPTEPAPLIDLRGVGYRYANRPRPQLEDVDLAVAAGERLLVTGASGAGKSTLAAILAGLRAPSAGRLSLGGIDQRALGPGRWRRAVGAVPQFHENHVLGADLLFNLLMGRRWPPRAADIALAESVCRELGLGALLDRMPAGLQQVVGETGWQLSHGERSRLYIARSLLQALEARVLDESFAALDPETLEQVMAAVLARPEALIVIAHP